MENLKIEDPRIKEELELYEMLKKLSIEWYGKYTNKAMDKTIRRLLTEDNQRKAKEKRMTVIRDSNSQKTKKGYDRV